MPTPEDRTATIGDLSLHYLDWGTAGMPPLVCLHGITQTAHSWDEGRNRTLARAHHVRALDQRGHGDSTWAPDGDYRLATQNHDVERFLHAIDATPSVLVALSMGGLVALTLAARAPELVRALVVVDTRARWCNGAASTTSGNVRRRDRRARHGSKDFVQARGNLVQSAPLAREHPRSPASQPEAVAERAMDLEVRPAIAESRPASAKTWGG